MLTDGTILELDPTPEGSSVDGARLKVTRLSPISSDVIGYLDRLAQNEWLPLFSKPMSGSRLPILGNGPLQETRKQAALWLAQRDDKMKALVAK